MHGLGALRVERRMSEPNPAAHAAAGSWTETLLVTALGGVLMLALTRPAFGTYFIAENFVYLGQYREVGDRFWRAVFSPTLGILFRPVLCAAALPWHFVLPLDPFAYHLRNFAFATVNLLLLHRVLLRVPSSMPGRLIAVVFFAISKIHLTTIGYVNIFDVILMLALALLTSLCLLRYLATRRMRDYLLALACGVLSIFSKDYALAVIAVLLAIVVAHELTAGTWRATMRPWLWRFVPLAATVAVYLGVRRFVIVEAPSGPLLIYVPELSFAVTTQKLLLFGSTLGNLSFFGGGTDGTKGLSLWLAHALSEPYTPERGETVFLVALLGLLAATFWAGRRAGPWLLVPAAWMAAYLAPTMLTRNMQLYYYQEPLVGVAIGLALAWQHLGAGLKRLWIVALALIALNGALGNPPLELHWAYCARRAAEIRAPVLAAHRGEALESLTFVTSDVRLWHFAIVGEHPTMLRELLDRPRLRVDVIDPAELPARRNEADASHLFFDADDRFAPIGRAP